MTDAAPSIGDPEPAADRVPVSDRACFFALVAATFVFLVIAGYPRQWSLGLLINDEFWYAHLARSLYEGTGYVTNAMYPMQAPYFDAFPVPEEMKQPGYSLVSAWVWQLTGVSERALLVVANVGLSLFAGLVFLLSRQLGWGWKSSLFVSAATVVNPLVVQYGVQALPESLYFACFTLVVISVLRGGVAAITLAGVAHAVLIVVKGHGIIYGPVFLGYLWMHGANSLGQAIRPDHRKLRTAATYLGVLLGTLVAAAVLLPDGSVQIFEASGSYSHGLLIETGRETSALAYLETQPVDPWAYILEHPGQYLDKVARQVRRTKVIVDDLGGPAFGGILFPSLLLCGFLLLANAVMPGSFLPAVSDDRRDVDRYLLFAALIGITFLFFWPIHLVTRFVTHALPLMLLLCMYVLRSLATPIERAQPALRRTLIVSGVLYFVAYPAAVTIWDSYRQPLKHVGSMLAVRFLDFERMAENVNTELREDPVVISEMAHEITWFTGARTILFPNFEDDLRYLVQRYDVDALYEHPLFPRDWPWILDEFVLVDDANGFFWVRRRDRE